MRIRVGAGYCQCKPKVVAGSNASGSTSQADWDNSMKIPLTTGGYVVPYSPKPSVSARYYDAEHQSSFIPKSPFILEEAATTLAATTLDMNRPGVGLKYDEGIVDDAMQIARLSQTHSRTWIETNLFKTKDGVPVGNTKARMTFSVPDNKVDFQHASVPRKPDSTVYTSISS
ncbi:hypothetical protein BDN70DRAFT_889497 [Pholiota conissans]|uniref:Uncharacterized protein n=1 Tax=Pholiota conissans TaxID=109636 RepID=A0A9P5ZD92_9AGAR|nr:hypothetical protein BDN70DRAFT_889497 [Pholiota conissans]